MTPLGWGAGGAKNRHTPTRAVQKRNNIDGMICQYKQKNELKFAQFIVH